MIKATTSYNHDYDYDYNCGYDYDYDCDYDYEYDHEYEYEVYSSLNANPDASARPHSRTNAPYKPKG